MRRRCVLAVSVAVVLVLSCGVSALASGTKTIELRWSTFFPAAHPLFPLSQRWGEEITRRTGGQVAFSYFPGGTLLKGNEIYDGILKGTTDIGMSVFAYTRGRFPAMEAVDLPLGYTTGTVATHVINDFYRHFTPKELDGVKVLFLHAHGPGLLHSKKAVRRLEDLRGLKIRSTGFSAKVAKALGAVPVAMPQGGTYEALQKGVVEATFSPMEVLKTWKQGEVVKYTVECYSVGYTSGFFVAMNLKTWNSLPSGVKRAFDAVSSEYIAKAGAVWDTGDEAGREFTLARGNEIIPLSAEESARWAKTVEPVIAEYIQKAGSKGLPGRDYVDTLKSLIKKYSR